MWENSDDSGRINPDKYTRAEDFRLRIAEKESQVLEISLSKVTVDVILPFELYMRVGYVRVGGGAGQLFFC